MFPPQTGMDLGPPKYIRYGMVWYGMVWHHACNVRQTEHLASNRVSDATPHIACRRYITRDGGRERERESDIERVVQGARSKIRGPSKVFGPVQGPPSSVQDVRPSFRPMADPIQCVDDGTILRLVYGIKGMPPFQPQRLPLPSFLDYSRYDCFEKSTNTVY